VAGVPWMLFQPREFEALRRILTLLLLPIKRWIYCHDGASQCFEQIRRAYSRCRPQPKAKENLG
jgi:hypothetical protein